MKLPEKINELIGDEEYKIDDIGMSGSSVLIFDRKVLKIQSECREADREGRVMQWLKGKLPVPEVLCQESRDGMNYLLMSKLPGVMSCDSYYMNRPEELVSVLAKGLEMLWQVEIAECPFCTNLDLKLEMARYNVENNLVDTDNCEPETFGEGGFESPKDLLDWLCENRPEEELVFSHGDYCLPNIFVEDGKVSGFLDLGKTGIADRYQDIALCYRSLLHNYEGKYSSTVSKSVALKEGFAPEMLFEKLGIEPDWEKIRYYILLDELF